MARLDQQALEALQSAQEIMRLLILKDVGSARDDNRPAYRKLLAMVRDAVSALSLPPEAERAFAVM